MIGEYERWEEEEEEEEGRLYLHLETRERVQTNEAKSKRRRASPTQTTSQRDNTPASQCLPSRRALGGGRSLRSERARAEPAEHAAWVGTESLQYVVAP